MMRWFSLSWFVCAAFAVLFALDREAAGEVALAGLPALRTARVEVLGPACAAGRTALVHADTHGAVPEARESDNVRSRPCREGGRAALH